VLEPGAEEALVGRHCGVEVLDGHADVVDRGRGLHSVDRI
jgi:hypothetical protein